MRKLNSIGIAKEPKDTLIVVAMSGGVDSSTVADMMKTEGYKVIGITLKLYNDTKETSQSLHALMCFTPVISYFVFAIHRTTKVIILSGFNDTVYCQSTYIFSNVFFNFHLPFIVDVSYKLSIEGV